MLMHFDVLALQLEYNNEILSYFSVSLSDLSFLSLLSK